MTWRPYADKGKKAVLESEVARDELVVERPDIAKVFPHGDGFMFVDRFHVERSGATWAEWTPRASDTVIAQHFTGHNVVPGVILIETCAQVAGLACAVSKARVARENGLGEAGIEALADTWYVVTDIHQAKFRWIVVAGTPLVVEPQPPAERKGTWTCDVAVRARDSGRLVATVSLRLAQMAKSDVIERVARAGGGRCQTSREQ